MKRVAGTRPFRKGDWKTFVKRLSAKVASAGCAHRHKLAVAVLKDMRISPESRHAVVWYCSENGGYCDCEILLNVSRAPRHFGAGGTEIW